ncbi:PqiC family protein [Roseivivax sp. CAU 1761]
MTLTTARRAARACRFAPLLALGLLAACGPGDQRFATPPSAPEARVASRYPTLEVVEVTLPTYAAGEEIFVEEPGGAITELGPLWADDPARAVTLQLSRDLGAITGAQVAPEPWPFRTFPAAKVDVRLEDMRATLAGGFMMSGQFFVAPEEGEGVGDRAGSFRIEVPLPENPSVRVIAAARSAAVTALAEQIARQGLR